jgi:hypothetical protein
VNAPFHQGIRIGSVKDGKVTAFIAAPDPKLEMPEGVTVDKDGRVFGGFTANTDVKEVGQELTASGTRTAQSGVRLQPPDPAGMYAPARPSLKAAN